MRTADPAAINMRAAHTHGATAEMGSAATHAHGATTEMGSAATHTHGATTKVGATATATAKVRATTAAAAEVTAAASAAKMSAPAPAATETAASRVSGRRHAKRNGYCGRACRDFPHDTPRRGQMRKQTPDRPVRSGVMLQCTRVHFAHR